MSTISIKVIDVPDQGIRVDTYITASSIGVSNGLSRSRLKNGVTSILINGRQSKLAKTVRENDIIDIEWIDPVPAHVESENIPLTIVYEDEQVTVVNKKQGMVTHPAAGNWNGTLVNALLYHWGIASKTHIEDNSERALRPGIVHRLDKDTSGLLITARDIESEMWLQTQFRSRRVKKTYAAIICGTLPDRHGTIKTHIMRDPRNRKKFIATENTEKGKFAHTVYRCVGIYGAYSLVLFTLKTGRTHQLRVHAKYMGCPILGDPVYGKKDSLFDTATLMLHAKELGIRLPNQSKFTLFKADIPLRFKKVMKTLKETYERR